MYRRLQKGTRRSEHRDHSFPFARRACGSSTCTGGYRRGREGANTGTIRSPSPEGHVVRPHVPEVTEGDAKERTPGPFVPLRPKGMWFCGGASPGSGPRPVFSTSRMTVLQRRHLSVSQGWYRATGWKGAVDRQQRASSVPRGRPRRDIGGQRPGVETIARRHGLPPGELVPFSQGTQIVWGTQRSVIKLFVPTWPEDARVEMSMLERLVGADRPML